jgi:non-homologous end joining protein Ku
LIAADDCHFVVWLFAGKAVAFAQERWRRSRARMRKLIAFDDDTFDKLKQLARDRMATIQELADEAFSDLLKKHGIPIDLKDALRKSASLAKKSEKSSPPRKPRS